MMSMQMHDSEFSPLQNDQNSKANSFVFAVHLRQLGLRSKDLQETEVQNDNVHITDWPRNTTADDRTIMRAVKKKNPKQVSEITNKVLRGEVKVS